MNNNRIQLTLFIDDKDSAAIEKIRKEFNPVQFALIKGHVTLCREDELEQIEKVMLNLRNLCLDSINIDFGEVVRFSEGKGVLIPAIGANEAFHNVRKKVLDGIIENPRTHEPHVTLMHPRNATCTDEIFQEIEKYTLPRTITFPKISLIEQKPGMQWNVLAEYDLFRSFEN